MLLDGVAGGSGLSLALTNKTQLGNCDMNSEEKRERLENVRRQELQKEIGLMINQIGKIDQPLG